MDRRVGAFLAAAADVPACVPALARPKQSLFIAETRESYWLLPIIKNALREFPGWDLFVCATPEVLAYLRPLVPARVKEICLDAPRRSSPETFSAIMFSPEVWRLFETEFVMIFQTDTVFVRGAAARLLEAPARDFLGAACGNIASPTEFVVNGGLSLRRVAAFAEATRLLTDADRATPEDVAFCEVMRRHPDKFSLPTVAECNAFAIESFGDPAAAVGIHGTDKYYAPPALLVAALGSPKKWIDCFPYDGEPILETRLKLLDSSVERFVLVEARFTHAGEPRALRFSREAFPKYAHKIVHVVVDEFPPAPPGYGADMPWVRDNAEAWWRERFQRDALKNGLTDVLEDALCIVSDVDEIPDPAALADLEVHGAEVAHLDMAFLVHRPVWQKRERWARAFACRKRALTEASPTELRCATPGRVVPHAGWHCSSFFDVDRQIQKVRSFAHREFAGEVDPAVVRARFETGRDPYGRDAAYDCEQTMEHAWLHFV